MIKKIKTTNKFILFFLSLMIVFLGSIFISSLWRNGQMDSTLNKMSNFYRNNKTLLKTAIQSRGNNKNQLKRPIKLPEASTVVSGETDIKPAIGEGLMAYSPKKKAEEAIKKDITEMIKNDAPMVDNFSFIAIGDAEDLKDDTGHAPELADLLGEAKTRQANFFIFTGDIISTNSTNKKNIKRIQDLKKLLDSYQNKYYIAFGKHDVECGPQCVDYWFETFFGRTLKPEEQKKLYHSFNYGNTHFVLLSTDFPQKHTLDVAQFQWLEKDLSKVNRKKTPNIIIVQHVPLITFFKKSAKECHDMSCQPEIVNQLLALYEKNKVDLVISGHEHAFDHKVERGIDFVLSGSVGQSPRYKGVIKGDIYSVFEINKETINLKSFNTKGRLIREIKIK